MNNKYDDHNNSMNLWIYAGKANDLWTRKKEFVMIESEMDKDNEEIWERRNIERFHWVSELIVREFGENVKAA